MMRRAFRVVDGVNRWTARLFMWLVVPGMVVILWEIVLRHILNEPTIWAHGVAQRIFAVYYFIGGGYILLIKQHINMDLIYNRLSLRKRAIVDMITVPLFFLFCGVLFWKGIDFFWTSWTLRETDATPFHAPMYPVKFVLPLGAFLILLQGLVKFARDLIKAITGREYEF